MIEQTRERTASFPLRPHKISGANNRVLQKTESKDLDTFSVAVVAETSGHFEAFVCNFTIVGKLYSWGRALEVKNEEV